MELSDGVLLETRQNRYLRQLIKLETKVTDTCTFGEALQLHMTSAQFQCLRNLFDKWKYVT
jgi:hypothetical protein